MTLHSSTWRRLPAERIQAAFQRTAKSLLAERLPQGHWGGELSASALSTATAIAALSLAQQQTQLNNTTFATLISAGIRWLQQHQLPDGGWGDTDKSHSNISTSMLVRAAFRLADQEFHQRTLIARLDRYLEEQGGVAAVHARYGKDRTFSAPILTQCALAGLVSWKEVAALPFELGCLPHSFYKIVRLPVVSYALPALIAIGQIKHQRDPSWNPVIRMLRQKAIRPTLKLLDRIQPASGGFLEATPLTSFVVMSLLGLGELEHPVVQRGLRFLQNSARPDGSWPIDTNLATWVTTLSVNALPELPEEQAVPVKNWLQAQQLQTVHPYTNAAPGGWAWTDLTGGVPDADDTPGAILALLKLSQGTSDSQQILQSTWNGVHWLCSLQNADGGWPTFCRGWGALPFDRSAADITAHALRALWQWQQSAQGSGLLTHSIQMRLKRSLDRGFSFLQRQQRGDGSWLPLWFGNQYAPDDSNPVYGTSRVLLAYQATGRGHQPDAVRGRKWLQTQQNSDGGWGAQSGTPSSIEETALALAPLLTRESLQTASIQNGLRWLIERVENTPGPLPPSPIGFYFAKLWYYERLYPQIFTVAALQAVCEILEPIENTEITQVAIDDTIPMK